MAGLLSDYDENADDGILPGRGNGFSQRMMNPLVLMGLGLASGKTPQEGFGGAMKGLMAANEYGQQQQSQQALFSALIKQGMTPQAARAMALNPQAANMLQPNLQFHPGGTDMLNNPLPPIIFNPRSGQATQGGQPMAGPMGGAAYPGAGGAGVPPPAGQQDAFGTALNRAPGAFAQGVTKYDPTLSGEEYLNQFNPEVRSSVQAYMEGRSMPTANPRLKGMAAAVPVIARKYATDIGHPELADESLFPARRTAYNDFVKSNNASMGGILANGKSAFAHLADLGDAMANTNAYTGPNFPGGSLAAQAGNYATQGPLASPETTRKLAAEKETALRHGQEATKFYAGSGGGEAERMHALNNATGPSVTSASKAGYLEAEKKMMLDRLEAKENQIKQNLGEGFVQRNPVKDEQLKANLARIDRAIARLKGEDKVPPPAETGLPSGWSVKVK